MDTRQCASKDSSHERGGLSVSEEAGSKGGGLSPTLIREGNECQTLDQEVDWGSHINLRRE